MVFTKDGRLAQVNSRTIYHGESPNRVRNAVLGSFLTDGSLPKDASWKDVVLAVEATGALITYLTPRVFPLIERYLFLPEGTLLEIPQEKGRFRLKADISRIKVAKEDQQPEETPDTEELGAIRLLKKITQAEKVLFPEGIILSSPARIKLTLEEKTESFKAIQDGIKAVNLWHRSSELSANVLEELKANIKSAAVARNTIFLSNLRLVSFVGNMHAFCSQVRYYGLDFQDLLQHGYIGLMQAIIKYNPNFGTTFGGYALRWIKNTMTRFFQNEGTTIRQPLHVHTLKNRFRRVKYEVGVEKFGRFPSSEEVAAILEIPIEEVKFMEGIEYKGQSESLESLDDLSERQDDGDTDSSIDQLILADKVEDGDPEVDPWTPVLRQEISRAFLRSQLLPREIDVLRYRFGIDDCGRWTINEIALMLGVTRQSVEQMKERTLRKLKNYGLLS